MADTLDAIIADLQNYVVAPAALFGLAGFAFDIEGESIVDLSADITDHYTEDNKALQDHIAVKPKRITLKGYVGEVVFTQSDNPLAIIQQVIQKLTAVSSYLPTLAAGTQQLIDSIDSETLPDTSLSDVADIYGAIKNLIPSSSTGPRQQAAYNYFKSLMTQGIIMAVQTPWEFMTNMAIESVVGIQAEGTTTITDFSIRLKQIRIAKTVTGAYSTNLAGQSSTPDNLSPTSNASALSQYRLENGLPTPPIDAQLQGAAALQAQGQVPQGNVPGVSLPTPTLPGWQSQLNSVSDILNNPGAVSILTRAGAQ